MAEPTIAGVPRNVAIVGGTVAVAGAYFLVNRRRAKATAVTNTPAVAASDTTGYSPSDLSTATAQMAPSVPTYASVGGSTTQGTSPAPAPYAPPTGEQLVGSGYGPPLDSSGKITTNVVSGSDAHTYQAVTQTQAQQLKGSGYTLYYQILPGVFTSIGGTNLLPNTSQWTRLN